MQFIVIEDFTGCDRKEIYRRFGERGRLKPDELIVHHSWIAADMSRCFLLVETDDVTLLRGVVRQLNTAGYGKIVLEPWPDMPKESKVILTAWNWILRLPTLDHTQIIKFTRAHHGGAGEAPESTVG